jgi:Zn-dependent membrane protease YugP
VALILLIIIGALVLFGPNLWVSHVLRKYNRTAEPNFPGTGGELARHLLDRFNLHDVKVVVTEAGDHYNPMDRSVALTQDKYDGKTLAAIVIAAHECGHAVQHARGETFFHLRKWLAQSASTAQIVGSAMLAVSPFFGALTFSPHVGLFSFAGAFLILGYGVLVQLITLPVEIDASFNKALPILASGYLSDAQIQPSRQILMAAALTYVAGALFQLLNFWRWLAIFRR